MNSNRRSPRAPWLATIACLTAACGGGSDADSADGALRGVIEGLANKDPSVLWTMLPPRWQDDVNGLIHDLAGKLDEGAYESGFRIAQKAIRVLRDKKEFFVGHPFVAMVVRDRERIDSRWSVVVDLFETLADSDLAKLSSLKTMDVGVFLKGPGRKFMQQLASLAELAPTDPFQKLRSLEVRHVSSDGETAQVDVVAEKRSKTLLLRRVDGHWVPAQLANRWDAEVTRLQGEIAKMQVQRTSEATRRALKKAETAIDQLAAATTQKEFNVLLGRFMQSSRRARPRPGR